MGVWAKPAGGASKNMTGDQGSYTGYMKFRERPTTRSEDLRQAQANFAEAANECSGIGDRVERNQCVRNNL